MRGNLRVVEYLAGLTDSDNDCQDKQLSTPLHIAATYGSTRVAEILLEAGADCARLDYQDQNPLHR